MGHRKEIFTKTPIFEGVLLPSGIKVLGERGGREEEKREREEGEEREEERGEGDEGEEKEEEEEGCGGGKKR